MTTPGITSCTRCGSPLDEKHIEKWGFRCEDCIGEGIGRLVNALIDHYRGDFIARHVRQATAENITGCE